MRWLVADWGESKRDVFDAVVRSLEAIGHTCRAVSRADAEGRDELVRAIGSGEFDALLTWQRFYKGQAEIRAALAASGMRTLYMDFGFVPHYGSVVFDTEGENAASSWPAMWADRPDAGLTEGELEAARAFIAAESARVRLLKRPASLDAHDLPSPFVFVPLQRPTDAVVRFDSTIRDFGALLRRVLLLARGTTFVVAKPHPHDHAMSLGVPDRIRGSHLVLRQRFGRENDAIGDYLLSRAALVVGINSNMLFRAVTFGTPVIAVGTGWFSGSGAMTEREGLEALTALRAPQPDLERGVRYVATCLARQLRVEELDDPVRLFAMLLRLGLVSPGMSSPGISSPGVSTSDVPARDALLSLVGDAA